MDTKKLRQKLLDLAIHGRLDPLDVRDHALQWKRMTLRDCIRVKSGNGINVKCNQQGRYPIYGGNGIAGYCNKYNVDKPTIVVGRVGFYCGSVHLVSGKAWVSDNAFVVSFDEKVLSLQFLKLLLLHLQLRQYSNSTAQPVISGKTIYPVEVRLPPLAEQRRIVTELERWFTLIDTIEQGKADLQAAVKQAKAKILDLAIHGKLVPQDPSDEPASDLLRRINPNAAPCDKGPYADGWCQTTLGAIGKWQSGATPSRLHKDYYGGNIPWLKTGDLNDGFITEIPEFITKKALEETSVKLNPIDSVLIAMYGATIGKVGILTFVATTNQACCACTDYVTDKMYLFYFLLANRNNFIAMGGGGAQPNISKEKIVNTEFPLPPLAEQRRIVAKIEELFARLDNIQSSL